METNALRANIVAARKAAQTLSALDGERRTRLLSDFAAALSEPSKRAALFAANAEDLADARREEAAGRLAPALAKRLVLDDEKLAGCQEGLRQLAAMPELTHRVVLRRLLDDGLTLSKVTCPLGVLGVVFEARPDAFVQITGLAWKSGNALIAKGGREATRTNQALARVAHEVLAKHDVEERALVLLSERSEVEELVRMNDVVDLLIARGSASFIKHVRATTTIPLMSHADGVCHIYLHGAYDPKTAAHLVRDAKCGYPAACNAVEAILWEEGAAATLDACVAELGAAKVELRGCEETRRRYPQMVAATDADWGTEYGALIVAVKKVSGLDGALAHIARYGSHHTDAILTSDRAAAARFQNEVDSACVFWNASTRFADGFRFGLGAEVGISTEKLHARGPVGVDGLLTYRWLLEGSGQAAGDYGPSRKRFLHRDLP